MWDVELMLAEMSWPQMVAWQRYAAVEPFGEDRADLRMGILASILANVNRDPKKRARAYTPRDFMPQFGPARHSAERHPMTHDEFQRFKSMARDTAQAN